MSSDRSTAPQGFSLRLMLDLSIGTSDPSAAAQEPQPTAEGAGVEAAGPSLVQGLGQFQQFPPHVQFSRPLLVFGTSQTSANRQQPTAQGLGVSAAGPSISQFQQVPPPTQSNASGGTLTPQASRYRGICKSGVTPSPQSHRHCRQGSHSRHGPPSSPVSTETSTVEESSDTTSGIDSSLSEGSLP